VCRCLVIGSPPRGTPRGGFEIEGGDEEIANGLQNDEQNHLDRFGQSIKSLNPTSCMVVAGLYCVRLDRSAS